jgi:hypothetical protein
MLNSKTLSSLDKTQVKSAMNTKIIVKVQVKRINLHQLKTKSTFH